MAAVSDGVINYEDIVAVRNQELHVEFIPPGNTSGPLEKDKDTKYQIQK